MFSIRRGWQYVVCRSLQLLPVCRKQNLESCSAWNFRNLYSVGFMERPRPPTISGTTWTISLGSRQAKAVSPRFRNHNCGWVRPNQFLAIGSSATFSVVASGTPPFTYTDEKWRGFCLVRTKTQSPSTRFNESDAWHLHRYCGRCERLRHKQRRAHGYQSPILTGRQ